MEPAVGHGSVWAQAVTVIPQTGAFVSKTGDGANEKLCCWATQRNTLTLIHLSLTFPFSPDDDFSPGLSFCSSHCTHTDQRHRSSRDVVRHLDTLETTATPLTNTHVNLRSSYDHAFKFQSRLPPPCSGVWEEGIVQSVVAPRRGDTELSTPSAVRISSGSSDTQSSSPFAAELHGQPKTHSGQDLSRH